ncbi:hypothetical protein GS504_01350 [Rhodococcus hoagii]|nr:hypothetical protein [Prescottella equi]
MTYRLPASLTPAPSDAYTVTGIKSLDTSDGYAYTGTLRAGKRIIGNVENSGTGGPTTVYLKDPAKDRAPWLEWAAKWPEARGPQDDEWAAAELAEEALLVKSLRNASRRGIPVLLDADLSSPIHGFSIATGFRSDTPGHLESLREDERLSAYWDGTAWVPMR